MTWIAWMVACASGPGTGGAPPPGGDGGFARGPTVAAPGAADTAAEVDPGDGAGDPPGFDLETGPPAAWAGPPLVLEGPVPRNVLVLSIDTLRRDRLGAFGGGADTPFLDELLARAAVMDRARACASFTQASFACTWLAALPLDFGFEPMSTDPAVPTTPGYLTTALAGLRAAGFELGLATGNAILFDGFPLVADFDVASGITYGTADEIGALGLAILDELSASGRPWLLEVHYMDVHAPYYAAEGDPLEGLDGLGLDYDLTTNDGVTRLRRDWPDMSPDDQARALQLVDVYYRAALRFLDAQIAWLWDELEARGALDDTLVVLWSDHGEQFWERGGYGHDLTMHAEETDALLAFLGPGVVPHTWDGPVSSMDLVPTLLELHGMSPPTQARGVSLLRDPPADRVLTGFRYFYGMPPRQYGIRGDTVVLYTWDGQRSAYDLALDPAERLDRYDPADPDVQAIWEVMGADALAADAFIPSWHPADPGP